MAIIGALVRIEATHYAAAWQALARLLGVTPFALNDLTRLGLIIEAPNLDQAYRLLQNDIRAAPGVLSVYPTYAHFENEPMVQ